VSEERKRVPVLGVAVDDIDMSSTLSRIRRWIHERAGVRICVAPVSTIVEASEDPEYQALVNGADLVVPDGMPVVWAARTKGARQVKRVCGPDLMRTICTDYSFTHVRHFFYGADQDTLDLLQSRLRDLNPEINICGAIAPPYFPEAVPESDEVIAKINAAEADIVWVGLGAPKQDLWAELHRDRLEAPVLIGIGAAFDFLSGVKPRAPRWMQACGLEWLFRLCCEPRRLWRRYLIGNTRFCWEIGKELFGMRKAVEKNAEK